ncbi:carboxypeptidase-like regulatory domain-containing protein [Bryobacter aggregatus]|uniref:carboxypeptidase regulatory-like domain-containing protein n=1 Tax=Bryobacter aggregatus TaxID=360054 RepID=UPI0004E13B94
MSRFALLLLNLSLLVFAQTDTATLSGTVFDTASAVVPNATLTVVNRATRLERTTQSGAEGRYQFNLLPPGSYELKVNASGFKLFADSEVRLQVAQNAVLNPTLAVGATSEMIEVSGSASLLNTESAASGTNITQEKIVSLPLNGRQFIQLALLVPGANSGGRQVQQNTARLNQTGGFSSSGAVPTTIFFSLTERPIPTPITMASAIRLSSIRCRNFRCSRLNMAPSMAALPVLRSMSCRSLVLMPFMAPPGSF